MPSHFFQCYPPFSALFLCSPLIMIPHEAQYKKESELEGKKNQYAKEPGILVWLRFSKELVNKSWFAPVEGNQKPVRRCKCVPKQGFNMTDISVLIQPEHHKGNISVVKDNKLHIRLLAVHFKWNIKSLFFTVLLPHTCSYYVMLHPKWGYVVWHYMLCLIDGIIIDL